MSDLGDRERDQLPGGRFRPPFLARMTVKKTWASIESKTPTPGQCQKQTGSSSSNAKPANPEAFHGDNYLRHGASLPGDLALRHHGESGTYCAPNESSAVK